MVVVREYCFPDDLWYTDEHVWVRRAKDVLVLGLDDLAAKLIGNVLVVMLANEGTELTPTMVFGTMESMKWVERLKSPISGVITEVNGELENMPILVNKEPYGKGWLVKIQGTENTDTELQKLVCGSRLPGWAEKEVEHRTAETKKIK